TDQEDHLMPQILELAQLVDQHGMPKVQVRRSRVETRLDTQRLTTLELFRQLRLDQYLFRTALDKRQLLFNRLHTQTRKAQIQRDPTIQDQPPNTSFCLGCDPKATCRRLPPLR